MGASASGGSGSGTRGSPGQEREGMHGGVRVQGRGHERSRPLRPTSARSQGRDGPRRCLLAKEASGLGSALGADVSSRFLDVVFLFWRNWWFSAGTITPLETLEVSGGIRAVGSFGGVWGVLLASDVESVAAAGTLGELGASHHSREVPPTSQVLSNLAQPWLPRLSSHPDPLETNSQPSIPLVSWVPVTVCWCPEVSSLRIHACTLELP